MWEINKSVGNSERHGPSEERFCKNSRKQLLDKIVKEGKFSIGSRVLIYRKKCKDSCVRMVI